MELYIHIPFCIRKCAYCDFLSGPADKQTQDRYMEALLREVEFVGAQNDSRNCGQTGEIVETIFIGGGTPSAVDASWIVRLMEQVRTSFALAEDAEITMEANPGTLTAEKLTQYRQAGINRLSMGLQSTDNGELARLGRIHTYEEFLENYQLARQAGFTNINIDLMSALPGQTVVSYEKTLRRIIALAPEHISAYSLIIEEGTPFGDRCPEQLPTEEEDRQMYHLTKDILFEAGYDRYEISNYARPGYECRHNVGYWTRIPYLGLGLGAASYYDGKRFANTRDMQEYLQILEMKENASDKCLEQLRQDVQILSTRDAMEECMFLGLRLTEGVSETHFQNQFGKPMEEVYGTVLKKMENQGLLTSKMVESSLETAGKDDWEADKVWRLTDLGLDVSNYVLAEFLL